MKTKFIFSVILTLCSVPFALSQVPRGFNYQALARDDAGNPIINTPLPVMITIQSSQSDGTVFWKELHSTVATNDFGMFTLVVGQGVRQSGTVATFADIDWSVTPKFIKTEIYYKNEWKNMGSSQLWAVPYSMAAEEITGSVRKLTVVGETTNMEEPLFEVKNKNGQTVFAVYNEGVRVYVDNGSKGAKGGFAIGGLGTDKGTSDPLFVVSADSIRAYIRQVPVKGVKGGFAIGSYDPSKAYTYEEYLQVTRDSTRIYVKEQNKGVKGGFAIGSFNAGKGTEIPFTSLTSSNYLIGHGSGSRLTTGLYNSFIGYESGKNNTSGSSNVMLGYKSGYSNTGGLDPNGSYNVFLGCESGYSNTTGAYNTFMGFRTGFSNTMGCYNVFIGYYAGYSNIGSGYAGFNGNNNVFIGTYSGYKNTTGLSNVFIGDLSGANNTTGRYNTYIGKNAAGQLAEGNFNVFLGAQAGEFKTGGSNNVFIGNGAGTNNTEGSGNVFVGYMAGYNETESNMLYIENSNSSTPLIGGRFDVDKVAINGIPDKTGATLQVNGSVRIGTGGSDINSVIKTVVAADLPSIAANTSYVQNFTVTGALLFSSVIVNPYSALTDGLEISYARVSSANTVEVKFRNTTGSPIDLPSMSWIITVIQ